MKKFLFYIICVFSIFVSCKTISNDVVETSKDVVAEQENAKAPYTEIGEPMTKPKEPKTEPKIEIIVPEPKPPKEVAKPQPKPKSKPETPKEQPKPEEVVVATFGEVKITQQDYVDTKAEMQVIVNDLNTITETENYERWLDYLSEDYKSYFSNRQILKEVSEKLPIKGIRLDTLKDYFKYVFVPARKNSRVDDIKFISATTVSVLMRDRGILLLVYSLENQQNSWKLVRGQSSQK